MNDCDVFLIFAENINFVYTLERFLRVPTIYNYVLEQKKENNAYPCKPHF